MADEGFKRKLTSILSADAVGYSRLMEDDEEATVRTLTSYREVIATLIKQHNGIVVDSPGDNLLAEFVSVVDAVQCAVSVQNEINARNDELPENRRMQFRIGINLGDVIQEEERIYGDGVNIAARLESLADPGGICISKTAFDQIERKLPYGYEFIGDQTVKNISKPVGAYRVMLEPRVTVAGEPEEEKPAPVRRISILVGATAVFVLAIAVVVWQFYERRPSVEPASIEKMAFPLPEMPSIAVLPFANMSADTSQEYFSDGLTEEIISALSKVPKVFVIARNSTFTYKGKPVKVQQVSEELGVRYVLEGSVRKAGNRVRITAQLIDAINGHHMWSERYDRDLKDIFALQDEITMKIITALQVELTEGEKARLWAKDTPNLKAYLKWLEGIEHMSHQTKEGNILTRSFAEEAIALDPNYPRPYQLLAMTHFMEIWLKTTKSPKQSLGRAIELAQKSIALDDSLADAHGLLGWLYTMARKHEKAIVEAKRAVVLDPNGASSHNFLSMALRYVGRYEEAIKEAKKAIRLDPIPSALYLRGLGMAYIGAGKYGEAIEVSRKAVAVEPNDYLSHIILLAAYSFADRNEEARKQKEEVLRLIPNFSLEYQAKIIPFKDRSELERFIGALRKAGLPE